MKYALFRVIVQAATQAEEGKPAVLDDDAPAVLNVAVEVPAGEGQNTIPLQVQIRNALEAARPGSVD